MRKGIKEKDIRDFEKYANKLDETMKRILEYNPNAEIFLNMDNLELFGKSFTGNGTYMEENKVSGVWIRHSSGGEK